MRNLGVLAALLVSMTTSEAHAGAWTPEPGHGYAKLWAKYLLGFGYVDGDGDATTYQRYHELFLATYGDIGLTDGLALFWHTDLIRSFYLRDPLADRTRGHVGLGDPMLGLRWRFLRLDRFVMAVEGSARAPLARRRFVQDVYDRSDPPEDIGDLQIGAGVWNVTGNLAWGYAFDRWYLAGSGGYQFRSDGFDDRVLFSVEAGLTLAEGWSGRLRAHGAISIVRGRAPYNESPSGIGNGVSYTGFAVELDRKLVEKWFLGMTIEGGTGLLRRQTGGPVLSLAISTQY